jgi:hypothetical protein
MANSIQFRRGTAAEATAANETLAAGMPGFETDTGKVKIGDGVTAWTSLPYLAGDGAVTVKNSIEEDTGDLQLVGDAASPGNSRYYGTDGAGAKGFHVLPAGGASGGGYPTRPGYWHQAADVHNGATITTGAPVAADYAWFAPFFVDQTVDVTAVGFNITTAGDATNQARLGLYSYSDGVPGTVLQQTTIATDTTGMKTWTLSPAVSVDPGWFFIAIAFQGTGALPQLRRQASATNFLFAARVDTATYTSETIVGQHLRMQAALTFVNNPTVLPMNQDRPWVEVRLV